jgi:hypothetical protein
MSHRSTGRSIEGTDEVITIRRTPLRSFGGWLLRPFNPFNLDWHRTPLDRAEV